MTTTDSDITQDMTAVEAANLLAKLEQGHEAAWLAAREAPWHSTEYQARFRNAVEVDGVFRDILRETAENGMRRPGEPVQEFAERASSEAWLAGRRSLEPAPDRDPVIQQPGTGTPPGRAGDAQHEMVTCLPDDARTPEGEAYTRAFSATAAAYVRELRTREPLPEPDRTPGAAHPDPFLAGRGWRVNQHGIYTRRAEPEPPVPPERELEAGL